MEREKRRKIIKLVLKLGFKCCYEAATACGLVFRQTISFISSDDSSNSLLMFPPHSASGVEARLEQHLVLRVAKARVQGGEIDDVRSTGHVRDGTREVAGNGKC
jgi:hypothetical protein